MKLSLNWLKEYLDGVGDVDALTHRLTFAGVEVEGVERRGGNWDKVVVARIVSSEPHPDADRLSVCQVDDGSGGEPRQIVCGAKNYQVGDKAPLALPGAVLPGNFKIKVGKLRGVRSEGMLCSGKELELGDDAAGIMILDPGLAVGQPLAEAIPPDVILDIEVTPNRPDLLSYTGVAREVAVLENREARFPAISEALPEGDAKDWPLRIEDGAACPFYSALLMDDVKVGPSPDWMVRRLESAGLRPINNVVDATNFVLLELGQPLHAFDRDLLKGSVVIRPGRAGETFLALDGNEYILESGDTVVADEEKALALGGVMGGEHTGVTGNSTSVLLESAWFDAPAIRRTSHRLGLSSDSSYRFERGIDPQGVVRALHRVAALIKESAGGRVTSRVLTAGALPEKPVTVSFRYRACWNVLGAELDRDEVDRLLAGFGLRETERSGDEVTWEIPSHRLDLQREIDLIEEIARVVGLDRIPSRRRAVFVAQSDDDRSYDRVFEVKRKLEGAGLFEARNFSLISRNDLELSAPGAGEPRKVRNPLSEDQEFLRSSLASGLVKAASHNRRMGRVRIALFEAGRVYLPDHVEEERVGVLMTGASVEAGWRDRRDRELDLFDLKGVVRAACGAEPEVTAREAEGAWAFVGVVLFGGEEVGWCGLLRPAMARAYDLDTPVWFMELRAPLLRRQSAGGERRYQPLARHPAVVRDIALVAPADLEQRNIRETLEGSGEPLLEHVEMFDLFRDDSGKKLSADKKSLAYSLTYRAKDRTLRLEEVTEVHDRILKRLRERLPVELRE